MPCRSFGSPQPGYGYTDTPKLFFNQHCGLLFGLAAWRAGYRMKGLEQQRDKKLR